MYRFQIEIEVADKISGEFSRRYLYERAANEKEAEAQAATRMLKKYHKPEIISVYHVASS